jgi:haloalkane dehalogenase
MMSLTEKDLKPPWLDRTIYPFTSRSVTVDGNTIHYVDEGSGPVLLMLHGNAAYSFLYREIISALSPHFRCIALDYPGFGLSSARSGYGFTPAEHSAVLENFVAALKLDAIRLLVADWGGPIGLGFAGRRPDLIHSLIIGNSWAWVPEKSSPLAKFSRIAGSPLGNFLICRFNILVRLMNPLGTKRKFTRAEKVAYRGPFPNWRSRRPMAVFPKEILKSHEFLSGVEAGLRRLRKKPVLLLWGDKDTGFTDIERSRFERLLPSSTTRILFGAHHFIQEDAPAEIAAEVLQFEGVARS